MDRYKQNGNNRDYRADQARSYDLAHDLKASGNKATEKPAIPKGGKGKIKRIQGGGHAERSLQST